MVPFPAERGVLFRDFAKALFKNDLEAVYNVVVPEFRRDHHTAFSKTKSLAGVEAIGAHLAEQNLKPAKWDANIDTYLFSKCRRKIG